MSNPPRVIVIGAANMDIAGKAAGELTPHDSNLGTVRLSHGGVGRNIAHNLALLGCEVHLIAPFGEDAPGDDLMRGCLAAGMRMEHSFRVSGAASSTYLYVMDKDGEMQVAVNDMSIIDQLTVERIEQRLDVIEAGDACIIDTNLSPEVLAWICEHVSVPLFCDPISAVKAPRIAPHIGRLHAIKPNMLEVEAITGMRARDAAGLHRLAEHMLSTGLDQLFVSLGARGLFCADGRRSALLPIMPHEVANATGAGDAMMAALVWANLAGMSLEETGRAGMACAAINVESSETVSPELSAEALLRRMDEMR